MDTSENIVSLTLNRDYKDFWGNRTVESSTTEWWHDADELKKLIKKGFDYALKHAVTGFLVTTDEHTYAFMADHSDIDNGTITMTKSWNHQYATDDPVVMNPTVARRALYRMAEATCA